MTAPVSRCGAQSARDPGDSACDSVGRRLHGIISQVRIVRGRPYLAVAQVLSDHRQVLADKQSAIRVAEQQGIPNGLVESIRNHLATTQQVGRPALCRRQSPGVRDTDDPCPPGTCRATPRDPVGGGRVACTALDPDVQPRLLHAMDSDVHERLGCRSSPHRGAKLGSRDDSFLGRYRPSAKSEDQLDN